ncbi:Oidioi.mRNA.OKI2018_I69.chr2.g6466.t1.cds [Oikopleura dioica]|uniref:TM2 domain-containing protein 3 n=1 Tax=Oikopleura dioica TaxID=34765 RepID=A0ABN7T9P4_OIKDI|nr:Oidioi.mRNA.OKI2018_I69.chr2.g6466.t1.cds [Oikopleura dioica]
MRLLEFLVLEKVAGLFEKTCPLVDSQCRNDCIAALEEQLKPRKSECWKPHDPCEELPDECFTSSLNKEACEIPLKNVHQVSKGDFANRTCIQGESSWTICEVSKKRSSQSTSCRLSKELKDLGIKRPAKNFTFTCEMCYMSDPKYLNNLQKDAALALIHDPRIGNCRTMPKDAGHLFKRPHFKMSVSVKEDHLCIGSRDFSRRFPCNFTSGRKRTSACAYSIFLGGFGVDRFYLGHWKSGVGKLLSFGGLGVWTVVDILLVCSGYIGPADGTLYDM